MTKRQRVTCEPTLALDPQTDYDVEGIRRFMVGFTPLDHAGRPILDMNKVWGSRQITKIAKKLQESAHHKAVMGLVLIGQNQALLVHYQTREIDLWVEWVDLHEISLEHIDRIFVSRPEMGYCGWRDELGYARKIKWIKPTSTSPLHPFQVDAKHEAMLVRLLAGMVKMDAKEQAIVNMRPLEDTVRVAFMDPIIKTPRSDTYVFGLAKVAPALMRRKVA